MIDTSAAAMTFSTLCRPRSLIWSRLGNASPQYSRLPIFQGDTLRHRLRRTEPVNVGLGAFAKSAADLVVVVQDREITRYLSFEETTLSAGIVV